jgi:hypothetical protein
MLALTRDFKSNRMMEQSPQTTTSHWSRGGICGSLGRDWASCSGSGIEMRTSWGTGQWRSDAWSTSHKHDTDFERDDPVLALLLDLIPNSRRRNESVIMFDYPLSKWWFTFLCRKLFSEDSCSQSQQSRNNVFSFWLQVTHRNVEWLRDVCYMTLHIPSVKWSQIPSKKQSGEAIPVAFPSGVSLFDRPFEMNQYNTSREQTF